MNTRQKEIIQHQLTAEKAVLGQLEKHYRAALKDIEQRIRLYQADELTQSRIYHIQYQKALKKQVEAALEKLHSDEYGTIQQYLSETYRDGYIGAMYDLAGQGMPVIAPIDRSAAIKAVMTDTQLRQPLYDDLGVDVAKLKRIIRSEITRGVASGAFWGDIARNISFHTNTPLNRAKLIVRTEAHRIQQASTEDARQTAKRKGADVVKQWDATLDGDTRPTHRALDGQIRETDEPFEMGGKKAMYPGGFGDPAEDCNCRCVALTRARAALDEDELKAMRKRAAFFELDKARDFEDFKAKYLRAAESVDKSGKSGIIGIGGKVIPIEETTVLNNARLQKRHGGIYIDAMTKTKKQLLQSIQSHEEEVRLHEEKMSTPSSYDVGWNEKTEQHKAGLLHKWEKDAIRNAEQAAIERAVYKERFGEPDDERHFGGGC